MDISAKDDKRPKNLTGYLAAGLNKSARDARRSKTGRKCLKSRLKTIVEDVKRQKKASLGGVLFLKSEPGCRLGKLFSYLFNMVNHN